MVYFIQGETTGLVKIGKANNVASRLRGLQAHSPDSLKVLAVIKDMDDDHPYHGTFASAWSHGEWFHPSTELMTFIATLPKNGWKGKKRVKIRNFVSQSSGLPKQTPKPYVSDEDLLKKAVARLQQPEDPSVVVDLSDYDWTDTCRKANRRAIWRNYTNGVGTARFLQEFKRQEALHASGN